MPIAAQYTLVVLGDSEIKSPEDLADVPVAIAQDAGSHYCIVEALEKHIAGDRIKLQHIGQGLARIKELFAGSIKAAVLMEPYMTIALKRGAVALMECRPDKGGVVATEQLDSETLHRFARAANRAVRAINEDPAKYMDILMEEVPPELREDVLPPRYIEAETFSQEDFQKLHGWMVEHGMIEANLRYGDVIEPVLTR